MEVEGCHLAAFDLSAISNKVQKISLPIVLRADQPP